MLLFCCACFVARDICFSRAMGFIAFDLLIFFCGFRAILRPQQPYVFCPSASPLLGGVLQLRQLVKVGILGCRSYFALPSATDARSGDTRRHSAAAPRSTRYARSAAGRRLPHPPPLAPPYGREGARAVFLFVRCAAGAAPLFLLFSHNFTNYPAKNKSFSGAAPDCCCLAARGGLSSR